MTSYRKASVYPSRSAGARMNPSLFVLHTTEGYGRDYLDKLFSGQVLRDGKQKISVHWAIYRDGSIVEYAPWRPGEAVKCIHAGESSWRGRKSCNNFALGAEIEHKQGDPYPEVVLEAIVHLVRMVRAAYPSMELTEHKVISPGRKPDPTAPWDSVKDRVYAAWTEEVHDMTDEQDKMLRQLVLSEFARSYDMRILEAKIAGNESAVAELKSVKDAAVAARRKELKL